MTGHDLSHERSLMTSHDGPRRVMTGHDRAWPKTKIEDVTAGHDWS